MRSNIGLKVCINFCFVLGLHINLSEGVPVSNVQAIGSLLSADKVFLGKAGIRSALENGTLNMDEVYLLIIIFIGLKKPTITNLIGQIHKNTTLK